MLWGKRLELLVELLGRRPAKIAWLSNPDELPAKLNEVAVILDVGGDIWPKRVQLLKEAVPQITRLGFLNTRDARERFSTE
jgi:hypothetical protein